MEDDRADEEMPPVLNSDDRRAVSWLNDFRVVYALARRDNDWSYVASIADKPTEDEAKMKIKPTSKIQSLNREGHYRLTKPGTASACERLADPKIGILEVKMAKPPKKAYPTEHYRILPSLEGLSRILQTLKSDVLSIVRETDWGQEIITKDLRRYLSVEFKSHKEIKSAWNPSILHEIEFLARRSTKALGVLLGPKDLMIPIGKETVIERLRDMMHLAFALDFATMPEKMLEESGMKGRISIVSDIGQGNITLHLESEFYRQPGPKDSKKGDR